MQVRSAPDGGVAYVVDPSSESLQAVIDYVAAVGWPEAFHASLRQEARRAKRARKRTPLYIRKGGVRK